MGNFSLTSLRGIPNIENYFRQGVGREQLGTNLFRPDSRQDANEVGWYELSVNLELDDLALDFTFSQVKPGTHEIQFAGGVAVIATDLLEEKIVSNAFYHEIFTYTEDGMVDNIYHGLFLIWSEAPKELARALRRALLETVVDIADNPYA